MTGRQPVARPCQYPLFATHKPPCSSHPPMELEESQQPHIHLRANLGARSATPITRAVWVAGEDLQGGGLELVPKQSSLDADIFFSFFFFLNFIEV